MALSLDLSALTTAELTTLKDNLVANLNRGLSAQSYQIGSRQLTRASLTDTAELLNAVSAELTSRTDDTAGIGIVGFNEPE